jgi:uncharacterized damage-inducible protein DinB
MNKGDINRLALFSETVRDSTLKRLRLVPSGKENFRITKRSMSFADVALHLVEIDREMVRLVEKGFKTKNLGKSGKINIRNRKHYLNLIDKLEKMKKIRCNFITSLTNANLARKIKVDSTSGKKIEDIGYLIYRILDHEAHHRGQIAVWLNHI